MLLFRKLFVSIGSMLFCLLAISCASMAPEINHDDEAIIAAASAYLEQKVPGIIADMQKSDEFLIKRVPENDTKKEFYVLFEETYYSEYEWETESGAVETRLAPSFGGGAEVHIDKQTLKGVYHSLGQ